MLALKAYPHTPTTRPLTQLSLIVGGAFVGFWTLFVAAEILSDPGGWVAVAAVAAWVVPMLALTALALFRPTWAAPVLTGLVGLWVAASVVTVFVAEQWQAYEDSHGPISLMVLFALCIPVGALGWARSRLAGILLLLAVAAPVVSGVVAAAMGVGLGGTVVLLVLGVPFVALAVLLLVIDAMDRRAATATAGPPTGPPTGPTVPGPTTGPGTAS